MVRKAIIVLLTLATALILLFSLLRVRELPKRMVCGNNLKGIGTTLKVYVNDYPGQGSWGLVRGPYRG